ncbi:MAG: penicillin-binding protein [Deltaproteobacteria bacterium]|nr:penicillin-binding protein [Deltaproteobacteria bacterium]
MKPKDKKKVRFRIYFVASFLLLAMCIVLARAYQLQVVQKDRLLAIARDGYRGSTKLLPKRGAICDRRGHELALSVEVASIYAYPMRIRDKLQTAKKLSRVLDEKKGRLLALLNKKRSFVWIKRKISPEKAERVKALDLEAVGVTTESKRFYPGKEIAAHLIGFAGADNQGLEGLEIKYDEALRGPQNSLIQMKDALGRPFSIIKPTPTGDGMHDLILTIDKDIQYKAQQSLKSAVMKTKARSGHCLVVDPQTGEILAMAVVPEFNPNAFSRYRPDQWRNRVITDCFEPGSTIKAFLLAACLAKGVVTPKTRFDCEKGEYTIGAHVIHDTKSHGILNVSDIIVRSSNIGAIKIGKKLGYRRFYEYLAKFGFGRKTGIGLYGERKGFIRPASKAEPIDQATIFFGQGMTATSLQMAMAMAAIANGGKLMRPYVVKAIVDDSGNVVKETFPKVIRRVLSRLTSAQTARILEGVVGDRGTGRQAAIHGFRVAGKTGTAQKVDPETRIYSKDKFVAVFVGFVPVNRPRLVILAVIDEPEGVVYGGAVAGPVFQEVGLWALNHLRVNPQIRVVGRMTISGNTIKRGPASVAMDAKKGMRHTKAGLLPDFKGLGMRTVLRNGRSMGLKVLLEGTGIAFEQEPRPRTPLARVSTVKVRFRPPS